MTQAERFGIIERLLLARGSVAFADLQDRLGVSRATVFRDLRDLRDRMGVPVIRDGATGSYRIDRSVERYPLPGVWFSAGEIHALLSMQQLLAALDAGGILAEHIAPLRERLASMLETGQDSADVSSSVVSAFSALLPGIALPNTSRRSPRPSWNGGGSASSIVRAATARPASEKSRRSA